MTNVKANLICINTLIMISFKNTVMKIKNPENEYTEEQIRDED